MVEEPYDRGRLSGCLVANDILRVDEIYPQSIHVIDAKDKWDIRRDDMEYCCGRSTANWERKMNNSLGAGTPYAKVIGQFR